jgi:hypothetical protein
MDSPDQVLSTTTARVFQDPDGYEIVELSFSNGSALLMHASQYYAIIYDTASDEGRIEATLQIHKHRVAQQGKREATLAQEALDARQAAG